ncbi:MAG: hypothetical protein ACRDKZ_02645 [Actinomycetota bacterium]
MSETGASLEELERDLNKIPGVTGARIVGNGAPKEIHIVAAPGRHPKQIVRDVQSLARAGFGIAVDRRIVSVVQLTQASSVPAAVGRSIESADLRPRPVLEEVRTGTEGRGDWARVQLRWPDGSASEGRAAIGTSRELRARGAMEAAVDALEPALTSRAASVEVEHVIVQSIGPEESVAVRATYYYDGEGVPLMGTALVHEEVAEAGVRALLHAVNRKLVGS